MRRQFTQEEKNANGVTVGIIDHFFHKMRALSFLAESQIPHARQKQMNLVNELTGKMNAATEAARKPDASAMERGNSINTVADCLPQVLNNITLQHDAMLADTILISAFSVFDAYLSNLLRNLYSRKPTLIHSLENREITLADLLNNTKEQIISSLIDDDIESLLRKSYSEKFAKLATRFDVTITGFPNWPNFIECSQRRNLVTHCDGIVSEQYLEKCKEHNCKIPKEVVVGTKLNVSIDYLLNAIDVVNETGIKLGQVLWRVTCEDAIQAADEHLTNIVFELLKREKWQFVLRLSELTEDLSKRKNQHLREAKIAKLLLLNHAQAAKWSGDVNLCKKILNSVDWSDGLKELQLAVAVLEEKYDNAIELMKTVGPNSELLPMHGYVGWPIFREFRLVPQFMPAFESMFGVKFADEMKRISEKSVQESLLEGPQNASGPNA